MALQAPCSASDKRNGEHDGPAVLSGGRGVNGGKRNPDIKGQRSRILRREAHEGGRPATVAARNEIKPRP